LRGELDHESELRRNARPYPEAGAYMTVIPFRLMPGYAIAFLTPAIAEPSLIFSPYFVSSWPVLISR